jgi:ATP-dependent NAD(P)H-hydrate dehydratase
LNAAKSRNIPIIIDADALFVLSFDTSLVKGYTKCILTPNFMEFKRLFDSTVIKINEMRRYELINCLCYFKFNNEPEYDEKSTYNTFELQCNAVKRLAEKLENVTILKKGKVDIISNGQEVISNDVEGSLKRCGGIGDLLTGTLGTFAYWTDSNQQTEDNASQKQATILAAYSASLFIKECSRVAFNKFHRATLAVDVIDQIPSVFYDMFDKAT